MSALAMYVFRKKIGFHIKHKCKKKYTHGYGIKGCNSTINEA